MSKTFKLVIAALTVAMTCIAMMVIKIPIPATGAYINLGDCIELLSGVVLGPLYGGIATGLGSALADLLDEYVAFAPATFVIKAIMGYGLAAAGAIPGNAIQGTAGIVIATMFMPILGKLNLSPLRKDKPAPKRRNDEQ